MVKLMEIFLIQPIHAFLESTWASEKIMSGLQRAFFLCQSSPTLGPGLRAYDRASSRPFFRSGCLNASNLILYPLALIGALLVAELFDTVTVVAQGSISLSQ